MDEKKRAWNINKVKGDEKNYWKTDQENSMPHIEILGLSHKKS